MTDPQYRADMRRQLCDEDFLAKAPLAKQFIKKCFKKDERWNSCYSLKQKMTARIGYFFQADMAEYMRMCGYEVKMNSDCQWFVKASYKKKLELPPVNWDAVNRPWREHRAMTIPNGHHAIL